jgi:acyl carrier protein
MTVRPKTTFDRVAEIVAQQSNILPENVKPEDTLVSLGCDSLDNMELLMEIEDEFAIDVSDEISSAVTTIQSIVALVESLTKATSV